MIIVRCVLENDERKKNVTNNFFYDNAVIKQLRNYDVVYVPTSKTYSSLVDNK